MESFEKIIDVIRNEAMKGIANSSTISDQIIKEGIIHSNGSIDLGEISLDKDDYDIDSNIKFSDGDKVLVVKSGDESFIVICVINDFDSINTDKIILEGIIHSNGNINLDNTTLSKSNYEIDPDIKFSDGDKVLLFKISDSSYVVVCTLNTFDNRNDNTFNILDVYPVGSIYLSISSTNPSTYFGGTWVRWGEGRAVVGVSDSDSDFYPAEAKHGSKNLQRHTHTITNTSITTTVSQEGEHKHTVHLRQDGAAGEGSRERIGTSVYTSTTNNAMELAGAHTHTITVDGTTDSSGTGNSKNLQPYITCYMWKRTA